MQPVFGNIDSRDFLGENDAHSFFSSVLGDDYMETSGQRLLTNFFLWISVILSKHWKKQR